MNEKELAERAKYYGVTVEELKAFINYTPPEEDNAVQDS